MEAAEPVVSWEVLDDKDAYGRPWHPADAKHAPGEYRPNSAAHGCSLKASNRSSASVQSADDLALAEPLNCAVASVERAKRRYGIGCQDDTACIAKASNRRQRFARPSGAERKRLSIASCKAPCLPTPREAG